MTINHIILTFVDVGFQKNFTLGDATVICFSLFCIS